MDECSIALIERPRTVGAVKHNLDSKRHVPHGSDKHCPEEARVHRVTVFLDRSRASDEAVVQAIRQRHGTRPSPKFRPIRRTLFNPIIGAAIIACLSLSLEPQHLGLPSSILTTLAGAGTGALLGSDF